MTIDESLNYMPCLMEACSHCLVRGCDKPVEKIDEAKIVAIDIMRKYQKIQEVIADWKSDGGAFEMSEPYWLRLISEVLEDGKID